MDIENEAGGWFCTELNLGAPTIRENVTNRPNVDGVDDTTMFMGSCVVSANITALATVGARIDEVAAWFGPFMHPAARPVLHYVLDRGTNDERTITLRGSGYAWPVKGPYQRDIQLQWVAADPYAYDVTENEGTAWFGTPSSVGRIYNLTFDRTYVSTQDAGPTQAFLRNDGDVPAKPIFHVYGPVSMPTIFLGLAHIWPTTDFQVDADAHVTIDTDKHLCYRGDDPEDSVISWISFQDTVWPVFAPHTTTTMTLTWRRLQPCIPSLGHMAKRVPVVTWRLSLTPDSSRTCR